MTEQPFVSVVIPALNEEDYIKDTLISVKSQHADVPFEIVVVDNGSEDRTASVSAEYARVVECGERGFSAPKNAGAKASSGKLLLFLDADTILLPTTLDRMAAAFSDPAIVAAVPFLLPLSSNTVDVTFFAIYNKYIAKTISAKKPRGSAGCMMVRRDAFEKVGGFNNTVHTYEDFDLMKRLGKVGIAVFVDNAFALVSVRRIAKWGRITSARRYIHNLLKFELKKGTVMKSYEAIR